jgi:hypothetical protein
VTGKDATNNVGFVLRKGRPPATVTVVSTEERQTKTITKPQVTDTITKYQSGPAPKTVTLVKTHTDVSRVVRTHVDTITKYQTGPAPKTVNKTITDVSRVVRTQVSTITKPAQTITKTVNTNKGASTCKLRLSLSSDI